MTDADIIFEPDMSRPRRWQHLGEGNIAYVKQIRSEDVPRLFPQAPHLRRD